MTRMGLLAAGIVLAAVLWTGRTAAGCEPDCAGKECGDDGCGMSCGQCAAGFGCVAFACQPEVAGGCSPTEEPGCLGCPCEDCVCGMDEYCCKYHWDQACVQECSTDCGQDCGGAPDPCGDGKCNALGGEDCDTCPGDCLCPEGQKCSLGSCVAEGSSDGCVTTPVPGCKGCPCEGCVCSMDPYCCNVQWDGICVNECKLNCGQDCGPLSNCGNWSCEPWLGESCATCPNDCACQPFEVCLEGACTLNDGCTVTNLPGCAGCGCEDCVCAEVPTCCAAIWTQECADLCAGKCGGCLPNMCGNWSCEPWYAEDCNTCPDDCPCNWGEVCSGNTCVPNDGCTAWEGSGCMGCVCEACVCDSMPECCWLLWAKDCAGLCEADCGGCLANLCGNWSCDTFNGEDCGSCPGDCPCNKGQICQEGECVSGGTGPGCVTSMAPGCGGCSCESCVCGMDGYCCSNSWDGICVDECINQCGGCGPKCGDGTCDAAGGEACSGCPADCGCPAGQVCYDKVCCQPSCAGKECGSDGCGASCGKCLAGLCANGKCQTGLGCGEKSGPGCGGCLCEPCVCAADPYCCEVAWDAGCVNLCAVDCFGCDKIESCGDGFCAEVLGEECGTCPQDCGCLGNEVCQAGTCAVDYCALGLGDAGCCQGSLLVKCLGGEMLAVDCAGKGGLCGWFLGSETVTPGYYCGPEGKVDPAGDPGGTFPIDCPACAPGCADHDCGTDGCGGSCGTCGPGEACKLGTCVACQPECGGQECGTDGCGGTCGSCGDGKKCYQTVCVDCLPNCLGKECGPDGCGGGCGTCDPGFGCVEGSCKLGGCVSDCTGKECGDDGCGGNCGVCKAGQMCWEGECKKQCTPQCVGKQCGSDGCYGTCGECLEGFACDGKFKCVPACNPDCDGRQCGDDGCGGSCGECGKGEECKDARCAPACVPECDDRQCGDDGCNGSCGDCAPGLDCVARQCETPCLPACDGKECGPDGCGGACGECAGGTTCSGDGLCQDNDAEDDLHGDAGEESSTGRSGSCYVAVRAPAGPSLSGLLVLCLGLVLLRTRLRSR